MNRLETTLGRLKVKGEKALITFVTTGDPNIETTEKLVIQMVRSGADIIELGIPFSDPVAEGPIIQKASERALKNGICLDDVFEMVVRLREKVQVPLVLMMYMNSLYCYGKEEFFKVCERVGVDGVIVPDLPFEESDEIAGEAKKHGIHVIHLVSPTSKERIEKIAKDSKGFLYCVSSLGVTGIREKYQVDFQSFMGNVRRYTGTPAMLGFGISGAEQVRELREYADGVIVGSSIVKLIEEYGENSVMPVGIFVEQLKDALN